MCHIRNCHKCVRVCLETHLHYFFGLIIQILQRDLNKLSVSFVALFDKLQVSALEELEKALIEEVEAG